MASAAPIPAPGFLTRVGGVLSGVAAKVESLPGYKWASGKVQDVVTSQDAIHGWQDIYKGWTTKNGVPVALKTLTSSPKAAVTAARAARVARSVASDAGAGGRSVETAGTAVRGAKAASTAAKAAGAVSRDAQTVARGAGGDAAAFSKGSVDVQTTQQAMADGYRQTTTVDVTERQFVADLGGKGALRGAAGGASGAGQDLTGAARDAGSLGKGAGRIARAGKGAAGDLKGAAGGAGRDISAGGRGAAGDLTVASKAAAQDLKPPFGMEAFKQGLRELCTGFMKAAKVSGLVSAAISIVSNGYQVISGQEGMPEAMGNIVADSADGFVAGGLTAVASGGVLALVGGLFGLTAGLPFFLIGLGVSIGFYALFDTLFKSTFWGPIHDTVTNFLGG